MAIMEIGANISESISERSAVNYQVGFRLKLNLFCKRSNIEDPLS